MYDLYIIYSERIDQYYIGHTKDIEDRLERHNAEKSLSTKKAVIGVFDMQSITLVACLK